MLIAYQAPAAEKRLFWPINESDKPRKLVWFDIFTVDYS